MSVSRATRRRTLPARRLSRTLNQIWLSHFRTFVTMFLTILRTAGKTPEILRFTINSTTLTQGQVLVYLSTPSPGERMWWWLVCIWVTPILAIPTSYLILPVPSAPPVGRTSLSITSFSPALYWTPIGTHFHHSTLSPNSSRTTHLILFWTFYVTANFS